MAVNTNGQPLEFEALLDDREFQKAGERILKKFREITNAATKAEASRPVNSSAHHATMDALKQARLERAQALADMAKLNLLEKERTIELKKQAQAAKEAKVAKFPTTISNSQREIDAYYTTTNGSKEVTSTLNEQNKAQIAAAASASQLKTATVQGDQATKQSNLSKKEAAKLLAEEKYIQQQATKELKNRVREELNAKGSLEQRRAALIRLQTAYDRLSVSERNSAAGQRLNGAVGRLSEQVLTLEKTTGRAQRNVGNYLTKAWSGLKTIANILPGLGIAGLLAFAVEPLINYISSLDLFKKKLSQVEKEQLAVNEALKGSEYQKAVKSVDELTIHVDLAKKGLFDKKTVVDEYNKSIGDVSGQVKTLDEVEKGLVKNADAYIRMTLYKAAANLQLEQAAKKAAEIQEDSAKKARDFATAGDKALGSFAASGVNNEYDVGRFDAKGYEKSLKENGEKRKKARLKQLKQEEDDFKENAKALLNKASDAAGEIGGVLGLDVNKELEAAKKREDAAKKAAEASRAELAARNAFQKKINDLIDQSNKKQLSSDEQELESVRLKYASMRKELEEYYKKHKQFRVDASGLDKAEAAETSAIRYKQETEALKVSLNEQKQLQADYEAYRADFGEEKARERFGKEVNYLKQLEDERAKITSPNERSKYLDEQIAAEKKAEQKRMDDLLKQFQTYADERAHKIEKFEKIAADLRKKGHEEQAKLAEEEGRKQVQELDENNIKSWESYKRLFDNLETHSKKQTQEAIASYKEKLKAFTGSAKAKAEAEKELANLEKSLAKGDKDGLRDAAEQLGRIASQFNDINGNIGSITSVLVNAASSYVEILKGMEDFQKADKDENNLGKITAGLGIAGAAINVATSIVKFFKAAKESRKQAAAEMQKFQDDAIRGELAYNQLLRERERTLKNINSLTIADLRNQQALLGTQTTQAQKDFNRLLSLLKTSGQQITGIREEKYGGFLGIGRKTRTVQDTAGIAGLTYEQLEALFTQGKLTDSTKQWFSELQKAKAELEAIGVSGQDVLDAINQVATGTTASSIADAIVAGFRQGKRSAADFADDFKGLMTDAALSVFKSNFLNKAIDGFYKDFAAASEDGLSDRDVQTLRDAYSKIITDGAAKLADFDKIIGAGGSTPTGAGGLSGAIARGITEDTAGLIVGQFNGMRLAQIETNNLLKPISKSVGDLFLIARDNFDTQLKIEANTRRTADNTDQLAEMKTVLKSIDTKMNNASNSLAAGGRI